MNWIECIERSWYIKTNELKTTRFVHLTDIKVTWRNAPEVSQNGRLRWKIENEGFNCQKNHGYNLQHKYSRSNYRAMKNYYQCLQIAHLLNQLVELSVNFLNIVTNKKGIINDLFNEFRTLPGEAKRELGKPLNELKTLAQARLEEFRQILAERAKK